MAELASAYISLIPSMKGAQGAISSEASSAGTVAGRSFGKMFALGAAVIAAAGVGKLLKGSIEEAREANKIGATTEQVIKATGGAANLTAKQVGNLSGALSSKIGVDDEVIQQGANLLLTFKNVRNEAGKGADIFTRATQAGADLAATGFGSIESNAKTLGKALNDPTKGITALTRAGVTFTQKQKDQIAGFVETGDLLSAQKIILGEVEAQVGGVAAATATSTDKAKVAWGNLKEDLGQKLIPIVDKVADAFVKIAPKVTPAIGQIGDAIGRAQAFLEPFIATALGFFKGEGGSAIQGFATQAVGLFKTQLLPVLQQGADTFRDVILPAIIALAGYVRANLFPIFQQVAAIVITQVVPIFAKLATFIYGTLYPAIVQIVVAVAQNLRPVFDQLVATFQNSVLPTISKLLVKFEEARPTIEKVVTVVVKLVGKVLEFVAAVLGKVIPVLIRFVGYVLERIVPAVADFIGIIAKIIGKLIDVGKAVGDFVVKVKEKFDRAKEIVSDAASQIKGFISDAFAAMLAPIQLVIDKIQWLIDKIKSIPKPDLPNLPGLGRTSAVASTPVRGISQTSGVLPPKSTLAGTDSLADTNARLDALIAAVHSVAPGVGGEINGAFRAGVRKAYAS